jgi:hypothetical protein
VLFGAEGGDYTAAIVLPAVESPHPLSGGNRSMGLSQLALSIAESPTLKLNEEARILREKGEAVIHLGIGEPKNKTPIAAILSSASKLVNGDIAAEIRKLKKEPEQVCSLLFSIRSPFLV